MSKKQLAKAKSQGMTLPPAAPAVLPPQQQQQQPPPPQPKSKPLLDGATGTGKKLSFVTKKGVPMTPAQIHNHLATLTKNAALALEEVPAAPVVPGGSTKGSGGKAKGKGGAGKDADAKPTNKMPSNLTTTDVKAAGGGAWLYSRTRFYAGR